VLKRSDEWGKLSCLLLQAVRYQEAAFGFVLPAPLACRLRWLPHFIRQRWLPHLKTMDYVRGCSLMDLVSWRTVDRPPKIAL
jgi:hypothetical protein